jgi:diacylglycerol kinase (ATP)
LIVIRLGWLVQCPKSEVLVLREVKLRFKFVRSRVTSFKNALIGWWHVIKTQQNAWIHALATVSVILAAFWLRISLRDWAVLIIAIAMVWMAEFLNTALEIVVDLASPDLHPLARVGKDVGAASVLISAASAVIIGVLILGPPLLGKISMLFKTL